jgi:hypothetical protein
MKLVKSQNLVYSSQAAQNESTILVEQTNSQSSSSSFISINQTTPTRSQMPQLATLTSMGNMSNNSGTAGTNHPGTLNRSNTITPITSSHSMTQMSYQKMLTGNQNSAQKPPQTTSSQNQVHLICNKCGVNISNKINIHGDSNLSFFFLFPKNWFKKW